MLKISSVVAGEAFIFLKVISCEVQDEHGMIGEPGKRPIFVVENIAAG